MEAEGEDHLQYPQRYIGVLVVSANEQEYLKRMIIIVH